MESPIRPFLALQFCFFLFIIFAFRELYSYVYSLHRFSDFDLIIMGSTIVHHLCYWIPCSLLFLLDTFQKPLFLYKYKIQQKVVDLNLYLKCFAFVTFNQIFVGLPVIYYGFPYGKAMGIHATEEMPSLGIMFRNLLIFILMEDILFFSTHYMFHSKLLYAKFHKLHHNFVAPVGAACEYAHPLEHLCCNIFPMLAGPTLCGAHCVEIWIWMFIVMFSTVNGHSGYYFPYPLFGDSRIHDLHHSSFKDNYGALGLMDYLNSTKRDPDTKKE